MSRRCERQGTRPVTLPPVKSADRPLLAVLAAALVLWAWIAVPVALGARTFYLRDVFLTHVPLKAFGAAELRAGRIPAFNPAWGLGQPFRGNPNALAFYPGNLLYLVLPFWSAFNLHYALHWLLAFLTMAALARGLGQGRAGALLAGITYAGSGWMLSALTYYNTLTVAAWWPLVLLGAVWGGRRGIALGGIACGMALLGGEPVTAALGLVPLLLVAVSPSGRRQGRWRGVGTAVAIGALGLVIALPQVVATLRVLPFTVRGGQGVSAAQAADYTLHPLRLLELVLPFPFGWPTYIGPRAIWAVSVLPVVPLFLSLYAGIIALWLAAAASRRHRAWALLALAGPLVALAAGARGDLLVAFGFGLFRFPEKFVFWLALALPVLAGWGLERALSEGLGDGFRHWRKAAAVAGGLFLLLAGAVALAGPMLVAGVERNLATSDQRDMALALLRTQIGSWRLALAVAGAVLLLALAATRPRVPKLWQAALLTALQLAALLQLYPLATTDETAPYRAPGAWARRLGPGTAVLDASLAVPPWAPDPPYRLPSGPRTVVERFKAQDLSAAPGVLHGLTYPLAPDLEGMHTLLFKPMLDALPALDWEQRVRWFRSVGLQAIVVFEEPGVPGLRLLDSTERWGVTTRLYAVADPAPAAWWPRRLLPAATPEEARRIVTLHPDPIAEVAADTAEIKVPQDPAGSVRLLSATADRIEIETAGSGGIAVVRRAWQPLFVAREASGGENRHLATLPVNLNLLGVQVPAGRHRVVLEVSAWPEITAGCVALAALAAALAVLGRAIRPGSAARADGRASAPAATAP
jgi:hypothetical protein